MKIIIDGKAAEVSVSGGGLPEGTVAIKPLTKAEYDALTDEEKQADVAYAITDDAGSGGGSGGASEEIYSTEETRIGTWIDGKPLYRKTVSFTIPYTGGTNAAYALTDVVSNVESLTFCDGYWFNYGNSEWVPLRYIGGDGESIWFKNMVYGSRLNFGINNMNDARSAFLTVEYTKTTDTGGAT